MKECQTDFSPVILGGKSRWLCSGMAIFWGWKTLIFHEGNIRGIVEGGCPDPHAGIQVLCVAAVLWATLVNTQSHTHTWIAFSEQHSRISRLFQHPSSTYSDLFRAWKSQDKFQELVTVEATVRSHTILGAQFRHILANFDHQFIFCRQCRVELCVLQSLPETRHRSWGGRRPRSLTGVHLNDDLVQVLQQSHHNKFSFAGNRTIFGTEHKFISPWASWSSSKEG